MKTLLLALALALNAKGALITLNWLPVEGATNYETTLTPSPPALIPNLTNSVSIVYITADTKLLFTPDFQVVYQLRVNALLTNEVRALPPLYYRLDKEYPDCVADRYAWATNTLGQPLWSFAHIPLRKYRMGGTNTVSVPQGVQMRIVP